MGNLPLAEAVELPGFQWPQSMDDWILLRVQSTKGPTYKHHFRVSRNKPTPCPTPMSRYRVLPFWSVLGHCSMFPIPSPGLMSLQPSRFSIPPPSTRKNHSGIVVPGDFFQILPLSHSFIQSGLGSSIPSGLEDGASGEANLQHYKAYYIRFL